MRVAVTITGAIGVLLPLAGLPLVLGRLVNGRLAVVLLLFVSHILAATVFYFYALTESVDAAGYYFGYRIWMPLPWFSPGTSFVAHVVAALRNDLGATFLDCFLVFQAAGLLGVLYLLRTVLEIYEKTRAPFAVLPMWMLFTPTMHFWTAAVGKDAPVFLGISLVTWSAIDFRRRLIGVAAGLLITVMFRPHIALATLVALAGATMIHGQFSIGRKMPLLVIAVLGGGLLAGAVRSGLNIDVTNLNSLSDFLEMRSAIEASDRMGSSIGNASYLVKLLSLLFRPLFLDAENMFAVFASVENIGSVLLFGFLAKNFAQLWMLAKRVFFIRFVFCYATVLILLLAIGNYNLGLGLRQRLMAIPPLFALFVAVWVLKQSRRTGALKPSQTYGVSEPPSAAHE